MTIHPLDFESGTLVKHRYFVALRPAAHVLRAIAARAREAGVAKPNAPDRLHMTLAITDDYETEPSGLVDRMSAALAQLRFDAFDVRLTRFGHHGGSLVPSRAADLRRFQGEVARLLLAAGVAPRVGWSFSPHVTLGYDGPTAPFGNRPIDPICWRATEFVLIHSLLRLTMHRTLAVWPLIEQPRLL